MAKNLFETTDKKPLIHPIDKSELSEEFVLRKTSEQIRNTDDKDSNVIHKDIFRMHNATGQLTINAVFDDMFMPKESEPLNILNARIKENNEQEYLRLLARIDEIKKGLKQFPNTESYYRINAYLGEVYFRFEKWYKENNLNQPTEKVDKFFERTNLEKLSNDDYSEVLFTGDFTYELLDKKSLPEIKTMLDLLKENFQTLEQQFNEMMKKKIYFENIIDDYSRKKDKSNYHNFSIILESDKNIQLELDELSGSVKRQHSNILFLDLYIRKKFFKEQFAESKDMSMMGNDSPHELEKEKPSIIQPSQNEREELKSKVFEVLQQNKTIVLEMLPLKERKQNKKWKLSTEQIKIKLFSRENPKQKETIIRYIKEFRSKKNPH